MEGKLVKEYEDFYLISDKEIESGDEYVKLDNRPRTLLLGTTVASAKVPKLSLENCISIEKGYDIEELAKKSSHTQALFNDIACYETGFIRGFLASVEILGDKKFSEEDMLKSFITGVFTDEASDHDFEFTELMKDLQKTEWEVEILEVENDEVYSVSDTMKVAHNKAFDGVLFKHDVDGCLILKRK